MTWDFYNCDYCYKICECDNETQFEKYCGHGLCGNCERISFEKYGLQDEDVLKSCIVCEKFIDEN